jgi:hypothetical protein
MAARPTAPLSGWLHKEAAHLHTWRRRFFVLKGIAVARLAGRPQR